MQIVKTRYCHADLTNLCVHHDLIAQNEKVHLSGTYGKTFMPNFVKFSLLVEESTVQM